MFMALRFVLAATVCLGVFPQIASAADRPDVSVFLKQGKLTEAEQELSNYLKSNDGDDEAEYALGIVQLLQAFEGLSQDMYRYGLRSGNSGLLVFRLPLPENSNPEKIDHKKWVAVRQRLIDGLAKAANTLEKVEANDIKLVIPVGEIRLDLTGDGQTANDKPFWALFRQVSGIQQELSDEQKAFEIAFDATDVDWMLGYTHVLRGVLETWLGFDSSETFRYAGYLMFRGAEPPFPELGNRPARPTLSEDSIADGIASIHLMNFPVADAKRLKRARNHFLSMITCSRNSWKHCLAETDNDREWIPNPNQDSVVPLGVNQEQIEAWQQILNHGEAVLNGELLIPHWRVNNGTGINLKRVFEEARPFDVILWIHGAGAVPYLEKGTVLSPEDSNRMLDVFQGEFLTFAIWFN